MWRYEEELIRSTTQQEIIDAVNLLAKSPWFGYDLDYSGLLGGVTRNASGHIVAAETAHLVIYFSGVQIFLECKLLSRKYISANKYLCRS